MNEKKFVCDCDAIHQEVVDEVKQVMLGDAMLQRLASLYALLGNITRVKICLALRQHELCVCDLANVLSMSKSAVSHQLRKLREGQVVTCQQIGKEVYYKLDDEHVEQILGMSLAHIKH